MASSDTAKPATADVVNGLRNSDQFGGQIRFQNTVVDQQTQQLLRRHVLTDSFDYGGVPAVTGAALRAQASRIRKLVKTTMAAIIQVGTDLMAVQKTLDRGGQFRDWIESECGFSIRTAENYIRAAKFAEGKSATVAFLNPATVYRLSAKSAPTEIVNAVIQRVEKGEVVSDREVCTALEEARIQKREAERKERQSARRTVSKRTKAKWDAERIATESRAKKEAEERQQAVLAIIETIGDENARHLVEMMGKFDPYELFFCLKSEVAVLGESSLSEAAR
jgi:hypothetical protein